MARGEFGRELIALTNQVPFDDRINMRASLRDVSRTLVRDFLVKTGSKLAENVEDAKFSDILQQMDIVSGPEEALLPKNIALMMFSENPVHFFPYSQVDIVIFPNGKLQDPSNFIEVPSIKGPIDRMINEVMRYLKTNIIKERVVKLIDKVEAKRFFNYPYQALEEAVVNALYHRDYQIQEPVEISIEPDCIRIISYGGPDRSIKLSDLNHGIAHARRYRNRKLGDFLKELGLTEGKATGIPTIIKELKINGSPEAKFSTDEERTYFMATIPAHVDFIENDGENGIEVTQRQYEMMQLIKKNKRITYKELGENLKIAESTVERDIRILRKKGLLKYTGPARSGEWECNRERNIFFRI